MSSKIGSTAEALPEIDYPSSDGEPMAESSLHAYVIMMLFLTLDHLFAKVADVFVAADLFWYWEEGNPNAKRAPDVMVVKGAPKKHRLSFFSWLENGAIPSAIFEMASQGTWRENLTEKLRLYAELGVAEYFIFDPKAEFIQPPLQGFRRNGSGVYIALEPDSEGQLYSRELDVYMRKEGTFLRLIDAKTGQPLLSPVERAEREQLRADQLEAELARLRSKINSNGANGPGK